MGVSVSVTFDCTFMATTAWKMSEMVVIFASVTVSNIAGIVGSDTSLSRQTAAMKGQWCVFLITFCRQTADLFLSLSSFYYRPRQMRRSSRRRTYILSTSSHRLSLSNAIAGIPPPGSPKAIAGLTEPSQPYCIARNPASPGWATDFACDAEQRLASVPCSPFSMP